MSSNDNTSIQKESQEQFAFTWSEKWGKRKEMSLLVANAYENSSELSLQRKAFKVKECAKFLRFKACPTGADGHTRTLKKGNFCDDRICPVCNKKRAIRLISALMPALESCRFSYKIIFVTLTLRNVAEIRHDVYERLQKCWRGFQINFLLGRKHKNKGNQYYYDGPCVGGVVTLETTYNEEQEEGLVWHPHFHGILICKEYLNQEAASNYWEKVTGDSFIVGLTEVKFDPQRGILDSVLETVKYLAKLSYKMPENRIVELALALRRVRCINAFGVLKGFMQKWEEARKEEEHSLVCKKCGRDLIEMALKWYGSKYLLRNLSEERRRFSQKACCSKNINEVPLNSR